ncbi:MAG: membrane protein insertion efficiency factor YidD [Legionellales bacterium]|nr:membrane protein insertion efficiency factor YidD [Legionellales bacterium]
MFKSICKLMVRGYQVILSPYCRRCRYTPTCSQYALECLSTYPTFTALKKMFCRLLRCHPFSKHPIYDPVKHD